MKFNYFPETDSLYISLIDVPSADSQEVANGIVLDFDADGHLVGLDIQHASQVVDISRLETNALPITALTMATQAS
ncbi:MAG: DUF2283 domain-containing protein [Cyanobacteria bacterium P01_H01_bin.152]